MIAPVALPARPSRSAQSVFGMSRLSLGVRIDRWGRRCLAVQTAAAQIQAYLRDAAWHTPPGTPPPRAQCSAKSWARCG